MLKIEKKEMNYDLVVLLQGDEPINPKCQITVKPFKLNKSIQVLNLMKTLKIKKTLMILTRQSR